MDRLSKRMSELQQHHNARSREREADTKRRVAIAAVQEEHSEIVSEVLETSRDNLAKLKFLYDSNKTQARLTSKVTGQPPPADDDGGFPDALCDLLKNLDLTVAPLADEPKTTEPDGEPKTTEVDGGVGGGAPTSGVTTTGNRPRVQQQKPKQPKPTQNNPAVPTANQPNKDRQNERGVGGEKQKACSGASPGVRHAIETEPIDEPGVTNRPLFEQRSAEEVNGLHVVPMSEKGHMVVAAQTTAVIQFEKEETAAIAQLCRKMHKLPNGKFAPLPKLCGVAVEFAKDILLNMLKPLMSKRPLFVLQGGSRKRGHEHPDVATYLGAQPEPTKSVSICTMQTLLIHRAPLDTEWAVAEAVVQLCADTLDELRDGFHMAQKFQ